MRLAFLAVLASLAVFYVVRNVSSGFDDSFITYRYADNLRQGYGLVFNVGERHYGSTGMGFAILLGSLSMVLSPIQASWGEVQRIGHVLSAVSLAVLAWIVYGLFGRFLVPRWFAMLGSVATTIYLFTSSASNSVVGHETYPMLAALAAGASLIFFSHRYVAGASCLALSTMLRPDCALFVGLTLAVLIARRLGPWRDVGWRSIATFAGVCGGLIGAWVVFTTIYFGSPIPETMVAKKAQFLLELWPVFRLKIALAGLLELLTIGLGGLLLVGLSVAIYLGVLALRRPHRVAKEARDVLGWSMTWALFGLGLLLAYRSFRVSYWFWYLLPIYFSLFFSALVSTTWLAGQSRRAARTVVLCSLLFLAIDSPTAVRAMWTWLYQHPVNWHVHAYDPIVAYLHRREPSGTVIATPEPGALGYRLGPRFTVVDVLGLASPDVARHILDGDLDFPFLRWKPQYLIIAYAPGGYNADDRWWFASVYEPVAEFPDPGWQRTGERSPWLYHRIADPADVIRRSPASRK